MSDDATKSIQAEELTNTEVAPEPAAVTNNEDTTVPDATVQTEETFQTEGGDAKTESDVKDETEEKKVDVLKTTAKHNHTNPRNNNKFDPSLAPVTDDPAKMPAQIRTQVR